MFTEIEQKAIEEKLGQLRKVKEGNLSPQGLANLITQRRVGWIQEFLDETLTKYKRLNPEEQAYRIIFLDHMKINPEHSKVVRVSPTKIRVESYNFCPYLQACSQLGFDTRIICKEIGESSIQAMMNFINPNLKFSRNYEDIRPYNKDFCEEYIELVQTHNKLK